MKKSEIDQLIINLAENLITNEGSFENSAKQQSGSLSITDIPYMLSKLHNPPSVHPNISAEELGLGLSYKAIIL